MNDDDLPSELQSLFDAERRRPGPPSDAKARVAQALALTLAAGTTAAAGAASAAVGSSAAGGSVAGSGAASTVVGGAAAGGAVAGGAAAGGAVVGGAVAGAGLSAKVTGLALATALAGALGYGGVSALRTDDAPRTTPTVVSTPVLDAPVVPRPPGPALLEPPPRLPELAPTPPEVTPTPPRPAPARKPPLVAPREVPATPLLQPPAADTPSVASVARSAEERASRLRDERALLEGARRDLASGRAAVALDAVSAHAERFADGALVEEREALRVQALVRLGRADDARAAFARFQAAYPKSLFAPALEASLPR